MKEKSTSSFRLDEQVYLTMIVVAIVSLVVLGFRVASRHPCAPLTLLVQSSQDSFRKGNLISFRAQTTGGSEFAWDFGDGFRDKAADPTILHKFINAGTYTVRVTVDGNCSEFQTVAVREAAFVESNTAGGIFHGPDTAYINTAVRYEDISTKSTAWEWRFEDPGHVDAHTKSAVYVYKTPGIKRIFLTVNGRPDLMQSKYIWVVDPDAARNAEREKKAKVVKPAVPAIVYVPTNPSTPPLANPTDPAKLPEGPKKEEPKKEEPKKAPMIVNPQMEAMLKEVIAGTKTAQDFAPYFCGDLSTPVVYNTNNIAFSAMCANLKQLQPKKVKSIAVKLYPNPVTNCQQTMEVTVTMKKGLFNIKLGK